MRQNRLFRCTMIALMLVALPTIWSATADENPEETGWNSELAASYQHFFSAFSAENTMAALKMMPVEAFLSALKTEEPPLVLDVRTPGENQVLGFTLPHSLAVPMDQVFTPEILEKLEGRTVVVACKTGHRATAVALALRHVGLDDIRVLKGGVAALAAHLSPKTAY